MELKKLNLNSMEKFSHILDFYPPIFEGNPLNLVFLENADIIKNPHNYLEKLDNLDLTFEKREYLVSNYIGWDFPKFHFNKRPDPYALSEKLFMKFENLSNILLTQQNISPFIERNCKNKHIDIVIFLIVDGLGFYDLPEHTEAIPCLVQGISITEFGYRQILGKPYISQRLFNLGYKEQLGFSYFSIEENPLASDLFPTFSPSQMFRVREFKEIIDQLKSKTFYKTYIQVTLSGLDHLCHAYRDRPPIDYHIKDILEKFDSLIDCLARPGINILACLTSDHGILWRDNIENNLAIINDIFPEDIRAPRYIRGRFCRDYGHCVLSMGQNFTLLKYPFLTKKLRINEWGVHGGISAWESIVPFIIKTVTC